VNSGSKQAASIVEWLVLAIVVLATITLGVEEEVEPEIDLEISNLSGTMILTTRASMDALGLDDYDRGAIATINIDSLAVISEGCSDCVTNPTGIQMSGNVNLTELIDDAGRLGRIEAELNVTYLQEELSEGLIAREWLSIDWNAGDVSSHWEMVIVHNPPKWEPEGRYVAAFVPKDEDQQSRTGPWILIEALIDNSQNVRGCLPDSFMCSALTPDEINMTSKFKPATTPVTILHPNTWAKVEGTAQTNNSPTDVGGIREMIELGDEVSNTTPWCLATDEDIIASKSWEIKDSNGPILSPMGIWFEALGIPSTSFTPTSGTWNEVNLLTQDCASLMDDNGMLRFGVSALK
jgi:hypothetical protein